MSFYTWRNTTAKDKMLSVGPRVWRCTPTCPQKQRERILNAAALWRLQEV